MNAYTRIGLRGEYAAMKAAQSLVEHYSRLRDDQRAHDHDARALQIQGDLIARLCAFAGLTADELRDIVG